MCDTPGVAPCHMYAISTLSLCAVVPNVRRGYRICRVLGVGIIFAGTVLPQFCRIFDTHGLYRERVSTGLVRFCSMLAEHCGVLYRSF